LSAIKVKDSKKRARPGTRPEFLQNYIPENSQNNNNEEMENQDTSGSEDFNSGQIN